MNNVPHPFEFLLLALAAWRIFHLIAEDTILDRQRDWLIHETKGHLPSKWRKKIDIFFQCPWCLGAHIVWIGWVVWLLWPHAVVIGSVPLAGMALLAVFQKLYDFF